jgi:protein-disulfide isomerase
LIAHDALIGAPNDLDDMVKVDSVLRNVGLDLRQLALDRTRHAAQIDAILTRNAREARALGLRGTPGLLVDRHLISRALTFHQLQQVIARLRAGH